MHTFIAILAALIAGVNALVIRDGGCNFKLMSSGGVHGDISQLGDGQNRVGASGLQNAMYTMGDDGAMFDQNGRACRLTESTTQFQCDVGASPTTEFSIGCDGTLAYKGNSQFVACQTGDNGWNVYTTSGLGQTSCVDIKLNTDSCQSECPPNPAPEYPSTRVSPTSAPPAAKACPASLSGTFEFPHLIVPVSSANPDRAYGTQYNGQVSKSDICSVFNFDFPASYAGKTCSLVFLFPRQDQLTTSSFMITGDAKIGFAMLSGVANQATTHNSCPAVAKDYGVFSMAPGNSYHVASFACPAATRQSFLMMAAGTDFTYFQDYNPPG
jgi:Ubiquitin 3 binding protein But2 C-terminal domain